MVAAVAAVHVHHGNSDKGMILIISTADVSRIAATMAVW